MASCEYTLVVAGVSPGGRLVKKEDLGDRGYLRREMMGKKTAVEQMNKINEVIYGLLLKDTSQKRVKDYKVG
jgi:hypothetical protein